MKRLVLVAFEHDDVVGRHPDVSAPDDEKVRASVAMIIEMSFQKSVATVRHVCVAQLDDADDAKAKDALKLFTKTVGEVLK